MDEAAKALSSAKPGHKKTTIQAVNGLFPKTEKIAAFGQTVGQIANTMPKMPAVNSLAKSAVKPGTNAMATATSAAKTNPIKSTATMPGMPE